MTGAAGNTDADRAGRSPASPSARSGASAPPRPAGELLERRDPLLRLTVNGGVTSLPLMLAMLRAPLRRGALRATFALMLPLSSWLDHSVARRGAFFDWGLLLIMQATLPCCPAWRVSAFVANTPSLLAVEHCLQTLPRDGGRPPPLPPSAVAPPPASRPRRSPAL